MKSVKPDLRILLIEITQKCNASCDHCGSRCDINSEELLTREDLISLFKDVKQNIGTGCMLNITGGEPLMRRDLFEIMKVAHEMGFDWGMVSNGVLINDAVIEKMRATGMRTITISLDGLKETHESLRHLPGSFDIIIRNLKKLVAADFLDSVQVTFTANKRNYREFPKLYEILDEIGLDGIRTSCIDPIGRARDYPDLMMGKDELTYMTNFANRMNSEKRTPIIWGCPHFYDDRIKGRNFYCFAGILAASVLYNGDIFVCPNVPRRPELIQGNIRTHSFSKVWKKGFEWFRKRELPDTCSDCKYREKCAGDSVHTFDFEKGKPGFCYRDIFDTEIKDYRNYLAKKYGDYRLTSVDSLKPADDIYIEPAAYEDIKRYFHIGEKHPRSMFEQQMGLIGFKVDKDYVIKYVFPSVTKTLSSDMAKFTMDTIAQAERETSIYSRNIGFSDDKEDYIGAGLQFLGFIHSHPLQKELCYSVGDVMLHKRLHKRYGDYIGILINPLEDTIGAYYGPKPVQGNLKIISEQ